VRQKKVDSSVIKSIGFSGGVLEIRFCSGGAYRYWKVPAKIYRELMRAESKGRYYFKNIKGVYAVTKVS
jgi:hypothetical protein